MSKREKIIVFLMVVAIFYGGYEFFFASKNGTVVESQEKKGEMLDKFVTEVAVKLKKKDISKVDKYIIARAKDEWPSDPFVRVDLPMESELKQEHDKASVVKVNFKYSGYVEMGDRKLAVINGMEYSVGEELDAAGYIVNSISPTQVIIGIKKTDQTLVLPVEEMH